MHKGLLYPKEAWKDVGGYPEVMNEGREDWAFNVGLGRLGWCGVKIKEPGYLYRREGQNRTLKNTTRLWRRRFLEQLMILYPDVYDGRYPMGCCGGSQTSRARTAPRKLVGGIKGMRNLPGQSGMIKLRYNGLNVGASSFWGPATSTRYIFGGKRREGYVDELDVPGMLEIYQGGRQLFVMMVDPPQVDKQPKEYTPVAPEIPETFTAVPVEEEAVMETEEGVALHPSELTVSALREYVVGKDIYELEMMLEEEKNDQNRVTAVKAIEEAMVPETVVAGQ